MRCNDFEVVGFYTLRKTTHWDITYSNDIWCRPETLKNLLKILGVQKEIIRFDCVTNRLIWPNLWTELFACYHIRTFHSEVKSPLTSHSCLCTPVDFSRFFFHTTLVKNLKKYIRKFRLICIHIYIQIRMLLKKNFTPFCMLSLEYKMNIWPKVRKEQKVERKNGKTVIFIWIFGSCLVWSLWKLYCNVNCIASRYCKNKANLGQKPTSQIHFR